uniref:G-protein coupled receptors family 1 profile domain-containing protein n=1 Tax=Romanomermis culicivorax TaxID=13658 RepID=A0A915HY58_ROMCU
SSNSCIEPSLYAKLYLNDWTHETYVRVLFTCLYTLIFVVALTGNLLVIISVCTRKNLQSVRNTFIVSLSLSDLTVCLTSLPITPVYSFMKIWILGKAMCHFLPLIQGMSVSISSFTLTSIAIDRYILIVHPTKPPISMPYAISMILFTWLVAASLCAPLSYFSVYEYKEDNPSMVPSAPDFCGYFCFEKWPSDDAKRIYGTSVLIVQFLIPLLIISFSYANIYLKLKTSINAKRRKSLYARNVEYQQQY